MYYINNFKGLIYIYIQSNFYFFLQMHTIMYQHVEFYIIVWKVM